MSVKQKKTNFFQNQTVPQRSETKRYCRFEKFDIKYIDYKEVDFLKNFLNEQGKILPRRITCNKLKYQKKLAQAINRARQVALLPYVTDNLK